MWNEIFLALCVIMSSSCGVPEDLDESRFPIIDRTGDGAAGGAGGSGAPGGGANPGGSGPLGGAMNGGGGTTSPGNADAGTPPLAGGSGGGSASGCPDDITVLFNRPIQSGGCMGLGCHIPGNTTPDLVSPNPAERLLNVPSSCNGRPYIGAEDSFLVDKITGSPPECGSPMPFAMPDALSAADEACILQWVEEVSGG